MKTLLAFFGLVFFTLLTILGVVLVLYYFNMTDSPGILDRLMQTRINIPNLPGLSLTDGSTPNTEAMNSGASGDPQSGGSPLGEVQITVVGHGLISKVNPLESKPLPIVPTLEPPTFTPMPRPTATPVPRLDPVVYQTEAMIRLKRFASASESWLATNDQLMQNNNLLQDPTWQKTVKANLAEVADAGQALGNIGRPPEAYEAIDTWLMRVGPEAVHLQANYLRALDTGNPKDFTAAGDNFTRIKQYLTQAAQLMIAAGWKFE